MRSRMVYRAIVERHDLSDVNPDGHPNYEGWVTNYEELPIYLWETKSREAFSTSQVAVVAEVFAAIPLGTDIETGDRINEIYLRSGELYNDKLYRVEAITRRGLSHIELELKVIS